MRRERRRHLSGVEIKRPAGDVKNGIAGLEYGYEE
jgi:hypothetical protein